MDDSLCDLFEEPEYGETNKLAMGGGGGGGDDDLFALFDTTTLDGLPDFAVLPFTPNFEETPPAATAASAAAAATARKDIDVTSTHHHEQATRLVSHNSTASSAHLESETEADADAEADPETETTTPKSKRQKVAAAASNISEETNSDGQQRMSHITVERNRRKQMNEHLSVLRSLMPCFYVKRGDQASIIGGVVDYINELQQILQSLEAKKQRKVYSEVLSPRLVSSPRPSPLSPRKPPLSPRLNLPISPRTPQPGSPYRPRLQQPAAAAAGYLSPAITPTSQLEPSPTSSTSSVDNVNELVANSKSPVADVEVKFSGPNLLLKTVSPRIPGQAVKIISALEDLALEILSVNINTVDETLLNSFTIKIGIECQLSAEELAQQIQQTFC